jgi:hypothetical protein
MPVTVKVNGASNSLVHKGSNGISIATIPDVCKTPSPGGPVPIPYPNISQSATLAKGTTTVKADGGMMIAVKGSEFSLSNGDNAGVAGGVKSSTFMKESTWILYSFDVKMDGKNACRLTDKKFQNHENTVDMAGTIQVPRMPNATPQQFLQEIACRCDKKRDNNYENGQRRRCNDIGTQKHTCCNDALRRHAKSKRPPKVIGERGYTRQGKRCGRLPGGRRPPGTLWPDAQSLPPGARLFDFKFKCKWAKRTYNGPPRWSQKNLKQQYRDYKKLSTKLGINPRRKPPKIIHNQNCGS